MDGIAPYELLAADDLYLWRRWDEILHLGQKEHEHVYSTLVLTFKDIFTRRKAHITLI